MTKKGILALVASYSKNGARKTAKKYKVSVGRVYQIINLLRKNGAVIKKSPVRSNTFDWAEIAKEINSSK